MNQGHFVFSNGASSHGRQACTNIKHRSFSWEGDFRGPQTESGGLVGREWDKRALDAGRSQEPLLGLESRKLRTDRRQSHWSRKFKSSQIQSCCGLWCWPVCSTKDMLQPDREVSKLMTTFFFLTNTKRFCFATKKGMIQRKQNTCRSKRKSWLLF